MDGGRRKRGTRPWEKDEGGAIFALNEGRPMHLEKRISMFFFAEGDHCILRGMELISAGKKITLGVTLSLELEVLVYSSVEGNWNRAEFDGTHCDLE